RTGDGTTLLDYEKALAVELLKSPHLRDYKVGLIVFGTKAYDVLDPLPLSRSQEIIGERIMALGPTGTENSHLDRGLELARDMLNSSGGQGELFVLSDGNLYNYPEVMERSIQLLRQMNVDTSLIQVQAFPGMTGKFSDLAAQTGSNFSQFVYPLSGLSDHHPSGFCIAGDCLSGPDRRLYRHHREPEPLYNSRTGAERHSHRI
ncbi:MAG: hypothetical protein CG443_505, partial [Methanosaeta sp. ASP1-1]